ncbi:hypothetical protein QFZ53_002831 [Microbacterium natoriense]|uniref:Uncharacterized protein n=1 Tax=Microbacterium natoriense TaxID=284570 RepID=A0AAW8F0W5_9MICO|nr:hypothetical protein [Microbacterium natoriense]MDQ0648635.1 hypothetical protein [Microbacterium natoriense]
MGFTGHDHVIGLHRARLDRQREVEPPGRTAADSYEQEVRVAPATLPDALGIAQDLREPVGGRVRAYREGAQCLVFCTQLGPQRFEVVEVAFPFAQSCARRLAALAYGHSDAPDQGDHKDERAHDHHDRVRPEHDDHDDR